MTAYSAANRRKRVGDSRVAVGFLVTALCDECDIPAGLGVNGACRHAREVGFEPVKVYKFAAAVHRSESPELLRLLLDREIGRGGCCGNVHSLDRRLAVFTPGLERVLSGWNVLDFEIAVLVGNRKIWRRNHD